MKDADRTGLAAEWLEELHKRSRPDGTFVMRPGATQSRPDATAWAVLALSAAGTKPELLSQSRSALVRFQGDDGRVAMSVEHPRRCWPTPLAVLAWSGSPQHRQVMSRAVDFLLRHHGLVKKQIAIIGHDMSLKAWGWIHESHSWVHPTAWGLLALQAAGAGQHARADEAARMLMDRQLPEGGWNYGNTTVFGAKLLPMPENTGAALAALAGRVSSESVRVSLAYASEQAARSRTPRTLGNLILGLSAWGQRPAEAGSWLAQALQRIRTPRDCLSVEISVALVALLTTGRFTDGDREERPAE